MYITSFWFHSKLVLGKAKKPARYELAIDTVFFSKYLTLIFLKETFGYFQMNILIDFIITSSISQQGSFISKKLYVK